MPWVRIDDQFPQHPKVVSVGPLGIAMQVAGLCYANRFLTDGFIPESAVPTFMDFSELDEHAFNGRGDVCWIAVKKLLNAGLWDIADGGYHINNYLDYQPSKRTILKEREAAKLRMGKRRSGELPPNIDKTTGEVLEKFNNPTPTPTPVPKTNPIPVEKGTSASPQSSPPEWLNVLYQIKDWDYSKDDDLIKWVERHQCNETVLEQQANGLLSWWTSNKKKRTNPEATFKAWMLKGNNNGTKPTNQSHTDAEYQKSYNLFHKKTSSSS